MAPRRRFPHPLWLMLSLAVTAAIGGPGTYLLKPHLLRWYNLRHLTSPDLKLREQSLAYLIAHARTDEGVVASAAARLNVPDVKNFNQIVNAIDMGGQWRGPEIPDWAWLRWLGLLARDADPQARLLATQRLGDLTDLAGDPRVYVMLETLAGEADADVRYNAVIAAARLAGTLHAIRGFTSLIIRASGDQNQGIASQAWVFLGLLRPTGMPPADWRRASPEVALSVIWATAQLRPDTDTSTADAMNASSADPAVRAMGTYAMHLMDTSASAQALTDWLARREPLTEQTQTIYWRAILALPEDDRATPGVLASLASRFAAPTPGTPGTSGTPGLSGLPPALTSSPATSPTTSPADLAEPLRIVLAYRHGIQQQEEVAPLLAGDPLCAAAALAGTSAGRLTIPINAEMPHLLRLFALGATHEPRPQDLYPLLASDVPAIRDEACLFAAEHFNHDQNTQLIADALKDFDDNAKISGAVLAGLTGLQHDLLAKKADEATAWPVKQMERLGLWMQQPEPNADEQMTAAAAGLLTRDDIPKTTLLLVLMHRHQPVAYDYLLNPRGDPWPSLVGLMTYQHWWVVLHHFLPSGAPEFWPWADPALARFQIETIRDWCLVHPPARWGKPAGMKG